MPKFSSVWLDSNQRPLASDASSLTRLSYTLIYQDGWARTSDPSAPDRALYQLSYILLAGKEGFEPPILSGTLTACWHTTCRQPNNLAPREEFESPQAFTPYTELTAQPLTSQRTLEYVQLFTMESNQYLSPYASGSALPVELVNKNKKSCKFHILQDSFKFILFIDETKTNPVVPQGYSD